MHNLLIGCVLALALTTVFLWVRVRRLDIGSEALSEQCDKIIRAQTDIEELSSRVSDVADGCVRIDRELDAARKDVVELSKLQAADTKDIAARITEFNESLEKVRRGRNAGGSGNAWTSAQTLAGRHSSRDSVQDLIAQAEGPAANQ